MSLNSSILPPHIRQATFASDHSKKKQNIVNYNYWAANTYSINNVDCCGVVAPSSGCYQSFKTFQDRFSVIGGQRQCTSYCPVYIINPSPPSIISVDPIVEPIIVPEYTPPPIPTNAARITFRTEYLTIPNTPIIIQITGDGPFNMNGYLGKNIEADYGYTTNTGQRMYTIQNNYLNYNNNVYIDIINNISAVLSIYYNNGGIREIDNLKALYNLRELYLDNNGLTNINELKYNIALETLYLNNNQLTDITAIKALISLENLYISNNHIKDISIVSNFNNLRTIHIGYNAVSSIESLRSKSALTYINISYNQISDLSPLAGLTEVVFFGAEGNKITSIEPLLSMSQLYTINLANNQIQDINPLLIMLAAQTTSGGTLNASNNGLAGKINADGQYAIYILKHRGWACYI